MLVLMSIFLVSCGSYPSRGNYSGNNRYLTTPYYDRYGYGAVYKGSYRDNDDFRREGHGENRGRERYRDEGRYGGYHR